MIGLGDMLIELIEHSDITQQKSGNAGCVDHIAILVTGLYEIIGDLKAKGCQFLTEEPISITEPGWESHYIYLYGPSMESIELMEYL